MKRWHILQLGPTEILLHPAVVLYLLYSAVIGHLSFTLTAFASIILHEAAHGIISALLGQSPSSIEITPLGAVMRLEDEGKLPAFKRMLMILAGPAMSLMLCWLAVFLARHATLDIQIAQMLLLSNLSILLLNLLPVLPLDGGRLLMLLLERLIPKPIAVRMMKIISTAAGIGLILVNIRFSWRNGGWNLSLAFAGCCIIYSAAMLSITHAMDELRYFLDRKIALERKRKLKTEWITALHSTPVFHLVRRLPPGRLAVFICAEAGSGNILGCLHEAALIQRYLERPAISLKEALQESKDSVRFFQI